MKAVSSMLLAGLMTTANAEEATPQHDAVVNPEFEAINEALLAEGSNLRLLKIEYIVAPDVEGGDLAGRTIYANNRDLLLRSQWVPGDARRFADGNNLTQVSFPALADANVGTPNQLSGTPAVDAAFDTWDSGTRCSDLSILKRPWDDPDPSHVPFVLGLRAGLPRANPFMADITTMGWLPGWVFELIFSRNNVIGVCWTFIFTEPDPDNPTGPRVPTDVNGDGYRDIAFKEVWYNDRFNWSTDGSPGIDIETVALHENGHALGLGHFGTIFRDGGRTVHDGSLFGGIAATTERQLPLAKPSRRRTHLCATQRTRLVASASRLRITLSAILRKPKPFSENCTDT